MKYVIVCPECGNEYSATPSDYFWMRAGQQFPCECQGDAELGGCDIVERKYQVFTDDQGREWFGTMTSKVVEHATIENLEILVG